LPRERHGGDPMTAVQTVRTGSSPGLEAAVGTGPPASPRSPGAGPQVSLTFQRTLEDHSARTAPAEGHDQDRQSGRRHAPTGDRAGGTGAPTHTAQSTATGTPSSTAAIEGRTGASTEAAGTEEPKAEGTPQDGSGTAPASADGT